MRTLSVVPLALALATALAAGCGSGEKAAPEEGAPAADTAAATAATEVPVAPDACSFVSAADVAAIVGEGVTGTNNGPKKLRGVCFYELEGGGRVALSVYVGSDTAYGAFGEGTPVEGLGDEAQWVDVAHLLVVRKGETVIAVSPTIRKGAPSQDEEHAEARKIAEKALEKV